MSKAWAVKSLGDFSDIRYGYTAKADSDPVGPRFLRITDIQNGEVNWDKVPFCRVSEKDHAKHKVREGDIVFARTGATTGKSFLIKEAPDTVCASYLIKVRPDTNTVHPSFLNVYFQTSEYWKTIALGTEGAAQGGFNASKLAALSIPLPPLEEQRRIVAVLDEAFEGLARARTHAEANLQNARELFESHLVDLFTHPDPTWERAPLSKYCRKITVGHVGPMAKRYVPNGIPFLRSQNVRAFKIDLTGVKYIDDTFNRELHKSELRPGDVAIVRTGYPGTCAVIPDELNVANCADLVIARTGKMLNPHFLALLLNSSYGKSLVAGAAVGAAQKHFNVGSAKQAIFPFPPLSDQYLLVEQANEINTATNSIKNNIVAELQDLDDLRQSLLQKAFAGDLN